MIFSASFQLSKHFSVGNQLPFCTSNFEDNPLSDELSKPFPERPGSVGKLRGIISQDSCNSNVTSQLGLAARMFCCLAVKNRSTQVKNCDQRYIS